MSPSQTPEVGRAPSTRGTPLELSRLVGRRFHSTISLKTVYSTSSTTFDVARRL